MAEEQLYEVLTLTSCEEAIAAVGGRDKTLLGSFQYQDDFSPDAGHIIGSIQTAFLNSEDSHNEAIRCVRTWCKYVLPLMDIFLQLDDNPSREHIVQALVANQAELTKVTKKLEDCQKYLNKILGLITTLRAQLKSDFDEKSAYYQTLLTSMQYGTYAVGAAGAGAACYAAISSGLMTSTAAIAAEAGLATSATCLLGPLGLVIVVGAVGIGSYFTSKSVVDKIIKPQLNSHLANIQSKFADVHEKIDRTFEVTSNAIKILNRDILQTEDIRTERTTAHTLLALPALPRQLMINQANKLMKKCQKFVDDHPETTAISATTT